MTVGACIVACSVTASFSKASPSWLSFLAFSTPFGKSYLGVIPGSKLLEESALDPG